MVFRIDFKSEQEAGYGKTGRGFWRMRLSGAAWFCVISHRETGDRGQNGETPESMFRRFFISIGYVIFQVFQF